MNKLLEIVITHWTEPWSVGAKAFDMLSIQRRVDWRKVCVTIVHDGSDAFPNEYFCGFPFKVNQVCIPHGGVSAARNYAIDHCSATWIKFCDFDDMFAGAYSLSCIIDALEVSQKYGYVFLPYIAEMHNGKLLLLENSDVFIHDKVFRVSFLNEKDIRFNEELAFSEDFVFMALVKLNADKVKLGRVNSNFPLYVYIQRIDSVGNRQDLWYRNRCDLFKAHRCVVDALMEHGFDHEADVLIARTIAENLLTIKRADQSIDTSELRDLTLEYSDKNAGRISRLGVLDYDYVVTKTNQQNNANITIDELFEWIKR